MSAAELEAEASAQEQQSQQQQQNQSQSEEINTNTAINANATTTNSYNNNLDTETQLQMHQDPQQQELEGNSNNGITGLGLSLMNSSPPPHSYRHSRAYRHFKNPPQPHMCIRTTTEAGEELFINVLSWTRIVIPQEPSDPIPLYGGMRSREIGNGNGITLAVFAQQLDNKVASEQAEQQEQSPVSEDACVDQTDAGSSLNGSTIVLDNQPVALENEPEVKVAPPATTNGATTPASSHAAPTATATATSSPSPTPAPVVAPVVTATPPPAAPAKKEKLGGFLPNGCIFPRFKNNKHKDKDSSHKEGKSKEKTLLNALKKSKEKKVAPSEQPTEKAAASDNGTTQYEKNCINNLECEVQKLDLNSGSNGDNSMFIKLKVSPANATAAAAAAK
ncbi:GD12927 [Drosophila simulans]|uniref:GD12927 n=1 Tax=Drosophila simulans TaxID=7240 RepID=B4QN58_DROSI|nr:GD12927 [Drosophila simulans]